MKKAPFGQDEGPQPNPQDVAPCQANTVPCHQSIHDRMGWSKTQMAQMAAARVGTSGLGLRFRHTGQYGTTNDGPQPALLTWNTATGCHVAPVSWHSTYPPAAGNVADSEPPCRGVGPTTKRSLSQPPVADCAARAAGAMATTTSPAAASSSARRVVPRAAVVRVKRRVGARPVLCHTESRDGSRAVACPGAGLPPAAGTAGP